MAGIKLNEIQFDEKKKQGSISVEDLNFEAQAPNLREIYREASTKPADEVAEVNRVSRKLKADPLAVSEDLPQAKRAAEAPDFQEITSKAPVLSRKMQDPQFMSLSHDDKTLLETEQAFGDFSKDEEGQDDGGSMWDRVKYARETGQLQAELGLLRSHQIAGDTTPETEARIAEIKARMLETTDPYAKGRGLVERAVTGLAEMTPIMETGMIRGNELGLTTGAAAGLATLAGGGTAPALPFTAGAAYGAGMTVGTMQSIGEIEAGLAYDEFIDLVDDLGNTIDPTVAKSAAAVVGAINAAIEGLQIKTAIKTIPGGEELLRKLISENAKKIVKEYGQRGLAKTAAAGAVKYGTAVASETAQEIVQEMTNIVVGESIKQFSNQTAGTEFEGPDFEEIGARLQDTAVESALAFSLMVLPGSVARTSIDLERERKARAKIAKQEKFIDRLVELGAESKLKERDADGSYAGFVSELAKESGIENVYLQAGRAVQEMSTQGMSSKEIIDWFQQYDVSVDSLVAAVESGGSIQLPTGKVIAKIGDDVVLQQVRGQISQDPMGPAAATIDEDLADDAEADRHLQELDEQDRQAGLEQTDVDYLEQQLVAAGRTEEQAAADAQIYAAWAKIRGQKYGMTARQFLQEKWGLQFQQGEAVTDLGGVSYNVDDTPANRRFVEKDEAQRDALLASERAKLKDLEGQVRPYNDGTYKDLSDDETERKSELNSQIENLRQQIADYETIQNDEAEGANDTFNQPPEQQKIELAIDDIKLTGDESYQTEEEVSAHNAKAEILNLLWDEGFLSDDVLFAIRGLDVSKWDEYLIEEFMEKVGDRRTVDEIYQDHLENVQSDGIEDTDLDSFEPSTDLTEWAVAAMGLTDDINEAGYVLPDGRLLDFSGKREGGPGGERAMDHRQLAIPTKGDISGTDLMVAFQEQAGAVRIDANSGLADMEVEPTSKQLRVIKEMMDDRGGEGYVSFQDGNRRAEFEVNNTGKLAGMAKRFYSGDDLEGVTTLYQNRRLEALRNVRVADMSLEDLRKALLTNELTGIPNRRAYMEQTDFGKAPKPVQVSIDADSLAWVNDNMGHATGDAFLREIAAAVSEEGDQFFHVSGDEFVAQGDSFESMIESLQRIEERLANVVLTYTAPNGEIFTLNGLDITYGIAETLEEADRLLAENKRQREAEGLRASRKEPPKRLSRQAPTGRDVGDNQGASRIAERGKSTARPTAQLDLDFTADETDQGRPEGQRDLVGFYRPSGKPALPTPLKAELSRVNDHVQTGTFKSAIEVIGNSEQAAHVLAPIRKQAKEQFLILALDKDKNAIGIIDVSEGSLNASIVHPREAMGAAFNIPGVDSIYLAHNHPGGDPSPSREDIELTTRLKDLSDAAGVTVAGHIILGDNGTFSDFVNNERGTAEAGVRSKQIPVYGRPVFRGKRASQGEKITSSPGAAAVFSERPTGIMLLSTRNAPVGFIEMTADEMLKMRTGSVESGAGLLTRAVQQTGAAAFLVHIKSKDGQERIDDLKSIGGNVAKLGEVVGIRVLDVINTWPGSYRSLADGGNLTAASEFFQGDSDPMASISFNEDRTRTVISVFESADFSSVVHEGGHLFLEDLKRGALQDGIDVEQWETIKEWLGVGDDNVITRDQHEKFARGFEAYLREGKAPSLGLQGAFDQFKRWLMAIYRSLRQLNVTLNDDVRGVFDRMLATEDEIREAQQQDSMVAMFDRAFNSDGKVSADEIKEYADVVGAATDEAERKVNRHKLKGDDQRQALWKRTAEAESYQQPLYRALYFLSRGAFPDISLTRVAVESKHNSLAVALETEAQALLESTSETLVIDGHKKQATVSNAPEWFQEMNRGGRARIDKTTAANALKQFAAGKPFRSKVGQDVVDAYLESLVAQLGRMARDIDASDLQVGDTFTALRDNELVDGQVLSEAEGQGTIKIKIGGETQDVAMASVIEGVVSIHRQANDVIVLAEAATAGEAGKGLGLDPQLFKDQYGEDLYDQMPRYPGLWKDGGLSVAQASVETGFATPADFLDELAGYQEKPRARWVEERVAQLQVEHDDKLKAEDAIRNELQRKMLEIESRWLAKASGQQRKAAGRKALRRWAEERTARMGISDATDVYRLIQASRRLRKQAIAAQRRGDSAKAFDLNEKVRMNEELIQVHVKTREKLAKMQRAWSKMVDAKVDNNYRQQIYILLQRYQLTARDLVNRGAFSFAEGEQVQTLASFMDKILANASDFDSTPFFSDWLLEGTNEGAWRKGLKWGELEELHDLLTYLTERGREEFLGLLSDKKTRIQDVVDDCIEPAQNTRRKKTYTEGSVMRWITDRTRRYFAQTDMLAFIFRRMDGFKNVGKKGVAGPNERLLWHRLAAARDLRDQLAENLHAALDAKIQTLTKNAKRNKDLARLPLPQVFRNAGRVWTWERVVSLALNMGNNQNLQRIMEGMNLDIEQVRQIVAVLKAEDWRAIQGIWNAIDSLYPKIDKVHFNLNNFHVKKVPADAFSVETADGETVQLDGGYYPLKYDPELSDLVSQWNEKDDILSSHEALFQVPAAKSGFTRTRAESAGGLVPKLSLAVLTEHINDSLQYISFAETVKDIDRITRHEDYRGAAKGGTGDSGVLGRQAYEMIRPALSYAIRPTPEFSANMDKWLDRERVRATAFILAWNVSVAVKQVFSVPGIWFDIGIANWIRGVARVSASPLKSMEAMHELSTYMRNRSKSLDRDLMDSLKSLKPGRQFKGYSLDDVRNAGFIMIKTMDFLAVFPSWWGAYDQAMKQHGGDIDAAVRQANEKIRASQPSGTPIDLSAFQRQKGIMRLFTLFATFVMKYGNRQRESYSAWRSGSLPTHQYLWHAWLEAIMPPLLMTTAFSVVQTGEPPEPEDLARDVLLYQLVGLPFWRDVASLFAGAYKRDKISSPVFTGIEIVGETANKLVKAVNEGDEAAVLQLAWSLAELTSFYSGVPASRVYEKIMKGLEAMEAGEGTPLNLFIPPIEK